MKREGKTSDCSKNCREGGFTLLELLVAMLLLAMVCSMVYSSLNVGIRFSDKAEKKMANLTRQYGLLSLINRQVRNAWYDPTKNRLDISTKANLLRLVTRSPLLHPGAELVLAFYRYEPFEERIYYVEKLDYYNIDYGQDYLPPLESMIILKEDCGDLEFNYEIGEEGLIFLYQGREYEFRPGCPQ